MMIMTHSIKKYSLMAGMMTSLLLASCYEKYDPDTYAPDFEISGYSAADEIAPTNLAGYWAFDGDYVESKNSDAGEGVGTTFAAGFKGQCFKGALNSYVTADAPAEMLSMTSFTVSFWVNTPPPSTGIIGLFSLSKTDGFWGNIEMFFENGSSNSDGRFRTHVFNGTNDKEFPSNGIPNLFDKWVHITVTYDGATSIYKLYANGSLASTVDGAGFGGLDVTNPGKLVFGTAQFMTDPSIGCCGQQGWASYLTGNMDEVRIYNKALTATEVSALVILQGKGK
jgi:hypothetical protein